MAENTPMMKQYTSIKQQYPDCLLFFRLGDFYEMFNEDAQTGSDVLGLTLTTRDRNRPENERTPMCGIPYHAADAYIARLIARGYKVAICEQMEDPALCKGLVDRDIIRIVTPGTVIEDSMLVEGENNYLCALCLEENSAAAAFCDLSTGAFLVTAFSGKDRMDHLCNELGRFSPREAVLSAAAWEDGTLRDLLQNKLSCAVEEGGDRFDEAKCRDVLSRQFGGGDDLPAGQTAAVLAAGALLGYLYETQKTDLSHIRALTWYAGGQYMELDLTARRNLELTETLRTKEKKGSLLWVLDRTKTSMGSRLLKSWICRPLLSPVAIDRRLGAVEELVKDSVARGELGETLRGVTDLERLISRIVYGSAGGRDLTALSAGLGRLPQLRKLLSPMKSPLLREVSDGLDDLPELRDLIDRAMVDEPPFTVREGGLIRAGYNADVDRLRNIMENGAGMLAGIEARVKEETGIRTLKVSYNKVFGYYLEVSKSQADLVPDSWVRKQTTVNSERYINQELKDLEHDILSAQDKITALEYQLFTEVRQKAASLVAAVQESAGRVAELDVLCSFASAAADGGYCRPTVDLSDVIEITDGRHPMVEKMLGDSLFVPNDTTLSCGADRLSIITGPNMAGKSTYMRQVAIIVLMAQMGSFVPARSARIGVVDRVFTRIGASDDLSAGQSTFMVEMTEVAELLKNATGRSLLILDEIGRGTSTYDGMSIARAVLEYCADKKRLGARTLFATHYHELTRVAQEITGVRNYNIAAKKKKNDIIFLRKIVPGAADQSYGIEVAQLAGVPAKVIERAREILEELEEQGIAAPAPVRDEEDGQLTLGDVGCREVSDILRGTAVETLTPIEAMNLLYQLKQKLGS